MRLRNIPGADEVISNSPYCIQNPAEFRGKWHEFLGNKNPIHRSKLSGSKNRTDNKRYLLSYRRSAGLHRKHIGHLDRKSVV